MKADRPKATLVVIDDEPNPEFWTALGGSPSDVKVVTVRYFMKNYNKLINCINVPQHFPKNIIGSYS